jgi:hypothetical protein
MRAREPESSHSPLASKGSGARRCYHPNLAIQSASITKELQNWGRIAHVGGVPRRQRDLSLHLSRDAQREHRQELNELFLEARTLAVEN